MQFDPHVALGLDWRKLLEEEHQRRQYDWSRNARPKQLPPPGLWRFWVAMAGRGWGKTRVGSEYIRALATGGKHPRIAIVGPTAADVRDVMIEGESGILAVSPPDFMPLYEPSKRQITWPNGVIGKLYSGEEPDRLRGPQHHAGWLDEIAAWEYPETFTQFKMGFRLGKDLRCCITSTPKPCAVIRDLVKEAKQNPERVIIVRGSTYENQANLAPEFFTEVIKQYEGTRLGRQELDGELLEDTPGALWNTIILDRTRVRPEDAPEMARVVISVDPSVTSSEDSDECGLVVCGKGFDGDGYIIADRSGVMSPHEWATAAIKAYHEFGADVIVAETNNGGDLVGNTLLALDPSIAFRKVVASRGKHLRAEPVSAKWEQGQAHLIGNYAQLEEQMCAMASDGYTGKGSPDRLDAAVHGLTELLLGDGGMVQMFPDFRAKPRQNEPVHAVHIAESDLKEWWPRWVSVTVGGASAAHWWCRSPNGRLHIYREHLAVDQTPEQFGAAIAEKSRAEAAATRMVPVWMSEKAFERINGKSIGYSLAEGIQRSLGEHKSFLFTHTDVERAVADPIQRYRAIEARLDRMPKGFLSVQALPGKDQTGWDVVRELLRWRSKDPQAAQEAPDWDHARQLAAINMDEYFAYMGRFVEKPSEVRPLLWISPDCRALIQAMSGATRSEKDESALAQNGATFVLQSLRIGALASREEQGKPPMETFIGERMDRLSPDTTALSRHLVAEKAESDYSNKFKSAPITFRRVRR